MPAARSGESVADLLSASSVLLALYGFVFGVWYADIASGLGIKIPEHVADAETQRAQVATATRRVFPLTLGAIVGAAIFLPKAISLIRKLVEETHRGWPWFPHYSAIDTSYVVVSVAFAGFALWTVVLLVKLRNLAEKVKLPADRSTS